MKDITIDCLFSSAITELHLFHILWEYESENGHKVTDEIE